MMEVKRFNAPANTITRNVEQFTAPTGNIYESVMIIAKRANQISVELKQELSKKLEDFTSVNDNLEEVFENREQIEMSRYYEKLPKAGLLATQEFLEGKIYYRKAESIAKEALTKEFNSKEAAVKEALEKEASKEKAVSKEVTKETKGKK